MPDVEFLEPTDRPAAPDAAPEPRRSPATRTWIAPLAWLLAAAFAVAAPFQRVWTVRFGSGPGSFRENVDGWGRVSATGLTGAQDPRYGIVLCVAAGLVVAAAGAAFLGRRAVALPLGLIAATAFGTVTAMIYLLLDSLGGPRSVHADTGPFVWLTLAATVAATLGLAALFVPAAPSRRPPELRDGKQDVTEVEWDDPDAEVL